MSNCSHNFFVPIVYLRNCFYEETLRNATSRRWLMNEPARLSLSRFPSSFSLHLCLKRCKRQIPRAFFHLNSVASRFMGLIHTLRSLKSDCFFSSQIYDQKFCQLHSKGTTFKEQCVKLVSLRVSKTIIFIIKLATHATFQLS